jgi:S1-C subfamily serine protease
LPFYLNLFIFFPNLKPPKFFTEFKIMQDITKEFDKSIVTVFTYDARGITLDRAYGFFISKDGDVITNRHIFLNSDRAEIKTSQGKIYPVTGIVAEDTKINIVRISTMPQLKK